MTTPATATAPQVDIAVRPPSGRGLILDAVLCRHVADELERAVTRKDWQSVQLIISVLRHIAGEP